MSWVDGLAAAAWWVSGFGTGWLLAGWLLAGWLE
jgi:hypothetical protein